MTNELLSLLSFSLGIAAYSVSQLQQHGKLRWQDEAKNYFGFWGRNSWVRKYKREGSKTAIFKLPKAHNWYHKLFKLKYVERFPLSATFLSFLTDGYDFCQFLFFIFISLSVVPIIGWTYGIAFWILAHVIHFLLYRTLQR